MLQHLARHGVFAVIFGLLSYGAAAATVEAVTVDHDAGRYTIAMQVRVAVSAGAAYRVMTDFSALPQINDNVVLAEPLPNNRLHTVVQMCIAFFCRKIEQMQSVVTRAPDVLSMQVLPEQSDFRYGQAQWRFKSVNAHSSDLFFSAQLEPNFWIPPLIGPWLVQRKLQEQALITSTGIERVADERGY